MNLVVGSQQERKEKDVKEVQIGMISRVAIQYRMSVNDRMTAPLS